MIASNCQAHRNRVPAVSQHQSALLDWYDQHARRLPWRYAPGQPADAYRVWLSEVMLQQTTVASVIPYFLSFTERWPTVEALALAPLEDLLEAWAGLGYYARARNLHACARTVSLDHGGQFPSDLNALRALPGVGDYTAAAIRAVAFGLPAVVVDGNIERIMSRLARIEAPLPKGKVAIRAEAARRAPDQRCGDYAQALMDLGASICLPKAPRCAACPLAFECLALRDGGPELAAQYPRKLPKKAKPTRHGAALWLSDAQGRVFIRRRSEKGLLASMLEIPSTDWCSSDQPLAAPDWLGLDWQRQDAEVRHTFTHFHLRLTLYSARLPRGGDAALQATLSQERDARWVAPELLGELGLPTLMRKIAIAAELADGPG